MKCFHAASCFLLALFSSQIAKADLAPTLFDVQGSYFQLSSPGPTFGGTFVLAPDLAISSVNIADISSMGAVLDTYDSGRVVDETGRCDVRPGVRQPCTFTEFRFSGLDAAGMSALLNLVVDLPISFSSAVPNIIEPRVFYLSLSGPMSHADSFGAADKPFNGAIQSGTITAIAPVPEPASILLLITAAGAAIWRLRRRPA